MVLHVGLGPYVVLLVPHWWLSDTPRSAQVWLWKVAGLTRFQEVSPVSPVLSVAYYDEVASVI